MLGLVEDGVGPVIFCERFSENLLPVALCLLAVVFPSLLDVSLEGAVVSLEVRNQLLGDIGLPSLLGQG